MDKFMIRRTTGQTVMQVPLYAGRHRGREPARPEMPPWMGEHAPLCECSPGQPCMVHRYAR